MSRQHHTRSTGIGGTTTGQGGGSDPPDRGLGGKDGRRTHEGGRSRTARKSTSSQRAAARAAHLAGDDGEADTGDVAVEGEAAGLAAVADDAGSVGPAAGALARREEAIRHDQEEIRQAREQLEAERAAFERQRSRSRSVARRAAGQEHKEAEEKFNPTDEQYRHLTAIELDTMRPDDDPDVIAGTAHLNRRERARVDLRISGPTNGIVPRIVNPSHVPPDIGRPPAVIPGQAVRLSREQEIELLGREGLFRSGSWTAIPSEEDAGADMLEARRYRLGTGIRHVHMSASTQSERKENHSDNHRGHAASSHRAHPASGSGKKRESDKSRKSHRKSSRKSRRERTSRREQSGARRSGGGGGGPPGDSSPSTSRSPSGSRSRSRSSSPSHSRSRSPSPARHAARSRNRRAAAASVVRPPGALPGPLVSSTVPVATGLTAGLIQFRMDRFQPSISGGANGENIEDWILRCETALQAAVIPVAAWPQVMLSLIPADAILSITHDELDPDSPGRRDWTSRHHRPEPADHVWKRVKRCCIKFFTPLNGSIEAAIEHLRSMRFGIGEDFQEFLKRWERYGAGIKLQWSEREKQQAFMATLPYELQKKVSNNVIVASAISTSSADAGTPTIPWARFTEMTAALWESMYGEHVRQARKKDLLAVHMTATPEARLLAHATGQPLSDHLQIPDKSLYPNEPETDDEEMQPVSRAKRKPAASTGESPPPKKTKKEKKPAVNAVAVPMDTSHTYSTAQVYAVSAPQQQQYAPPQQQYAQPQQQFVQSQPQPVQQPMQQPFVQQPQYRQPQFVPQSAPSYQQQPPSQYAQSSLPPLNQPGPITTASGTYPSVRDMIWRCPEDEVEVMLRDKQRFPDNFVPLNPAQYPSLRAGGNLNRFCDFCGLNGHERHRCRSRANGEQPGRAYARILNRLQSGQPGSNPRNFDRFNTNGVAPQQPYYGNAPYQQQQAYQQQQPTYQQRPSYQPSNLSPANQAPVAPVHPDRVAQVPQTNATG